MESQHCEHVLPPCNGFLYDITRKVLPGAFFILFVASGTGVLILNLGSHEPVPSNYASGVAIAYGVLIALIAIGNFLLYARKRNSQIRSTTNSARSSTGDEGEVWHFRLKKCLVDYEDRQRRFVREFVLRRAMKRNLRKGSLNGASQIRHSNSNLTPDGATPMDRIDRDIDLERGETPSERITSGDLNPKTRGSIETTRMRDAPELSRAAKKHTRKSHDPEYQKHNLASSSRTSRVSTAATSNLLWGTHQGAPQRRAAPAKEMNFLTMQTRLTKPVLPDDMLRKHALQSGRRTRAGVSQLPHSDKVNTRIPSEPSVEGYMSDIPPEFKRSSDIRVLRLEILQQDTKYATSEAPGIEQRNFNPYMSFVDLVTPSLKNVEEAHYWKFDHVNKGLYETHTSNIPPGARSIRECGNKQSPVATDFHASDTHRAYAGPTDDCDSFTSSTKTRCQDTSTLSLSSPELAPQIPRADHGSSASGLSRQFISSLSGMFDCDDEQYEAHSATTMPPRELPDEKVLPSEEAPP